MNQQANTNKCLISKPAMGWLAQQKLTRADYNVFFAMCGLIDTDNNVTVGQTRIAANLKMQQSSVSRSIKKLTELDIIVVSRRVGRSSVYMVNPNVCFRGGNLQQKIVDYQEAKVARAREKQAESSAKQKE